MSKQPQKKKQKTSSQIYQKLTLKEQILHRPDTYVGSIDVVEEDESNPLWVYDEENNRMVKEAFSYSSAVCKIFDEILVNAIDASVNDETVTKIKVNVDADSGRISVWNDGQGIPVEIHTKERIWIPELIFFHFLTSSNYDDAEERFTGGRNGYAWGGSHPTQ